MPRAPADPLLPVRRPRRRRLETAIFGSRAFQTMSRGFSHALNRHPVATRAGVALARDVIAAGVARAYNSYANPPSDMPLYREGYDSAYSSQRTRAGSRRGSDASMASSLSNYLQVPGGSAGYGGKFPKKSRKAKKNKSGQTALYGYTQSLEINKYVTDPNAVYIGACSAPPFQIFRTFVIALSRMIIKKLLLKDVHDYGALQLGSKSFQCTIANPTNNTNLTFTFPILNTTTLKEFADRLGQIFWIIAGGGIAGPQNLIDPGVAVGALNYQNWIFETVRCAETLGEVDMRSTRVTLNSYLDAAVQNQSDTNLGASTDTVNAVTLEGYMYHKGGTHFQYRGNNTVNTFQANPNNGMIFVPAGSNAELHEPFPPQAVFAKKYSGVKLNPGIIKKFTLKYRETQYVNYWIKKFQLTAGLTWSDTTTNTTVTSLGDEKIWRGARLGKTVLIGLEKMLNRSPSDSVDVLFQCQYKIGGTASSKNKSYLPPDVYVEAAV